MVAIRQDFSDVAVVRLVLVEWLPLVAVAEAQLPLLPNVLSLPLVFCSARAVPRRLLLYALFVRMRLCHAV